MESYSRVCVVFVLGSVLTFLNSYCCRVKYKVSTGATSDDPDDSKMSLRASNIMYKRGVTGAGNRKGPLWTAPSKKTKSKKAEGEFENATVPKVVPREIESADTAGFQDDPKLSIPLLVRFAQRGFNFFILVRTG